MAKSHQVKSSDGQLIVTITDDGGKPAYEVSFQRSSCIMSSPLGLKTHFSDLTTGLEMGECEDRLVNEPYELRNIKQREVHYMAQESVCHFLKNGKPALDIIFRVTSRDVAFRYQVYPQGDRKSAVITAEESGFVLPDGTTTFLCPQSKPMGGFARTSPSYETNYSLDEPVGKNGWGEGYTFPCLFKVPWYRPQGRSDLWVLISETGVDGSYCASRLVNDKDGAYRIAFPQQGECNGIGSLRQPLPCQVSPHGVPSR